MKKILLIAAMLYSISAMAQTANFSGTWIIDKSRTTFGQGPEWILPKGFIITQATDKITIQTTLLDQQLGEHKSTETLPFDGSAASFTIYTGSKLRDSIKWNNDKQSFGLWSVSTHADGTAGLNITESCSLTDDGKTLMIDRKVVQVANGFSYTIKGFYTKQ